MQQIEYRNSRSGCKQIQIRSSESNFSLIFQQQRVQKMKLATVDTANAPDLYKAQPSALSIGSEYWTPEAEGESKRGFVLGIEEQEHSRAADGEGEEVGSIILPCIVFAEQTEKGGFKQVANGSKRLVGVIEDAIKGGTIVPGETPLQITYVGKKKNVTNSFKSDSWDVRPLIA